ncbi:MAG: hypothetical protein EBS26_01680 [Bacteroidia bacterium]|nr:hypothetical protein [Bacteroidia bacterium]
MLKQKYTIRFKTNLKLLYITSVEYISLLHCLAITEQQRARCSQGRRHRPILCIFYLGLPLCGRRLAGFTGSVF